MRFATPAEATWRLEDPLGESQELPGDFRNNYRSSPGTSVTILVGFCHLSWQFYEFQVPLSALELLPRSLELLLGPPRVRFGTPECPV